MIINERRWTKGGGRTAISNQVIGNNSKLLRSP
jgi:hypothetical protein